MGMMIIEKGIKIKTLLQGVQNLVWGGRVGRIDLMRRRREIGDQLWRSGNEGYEDFFAPDTLS